MAKRKIVEIEKNIRNVIESDILPMLRMDGGGVDFISYKNGVVEVRLSGACSCCPMSEITLKGMVEAILVNAIPEVKSIVNLEENFEDELIKEESTKCPNKPLKTKTSKSESVAGKSTKARKK
jgi:Fe-S cluster biogenesis protein NfuA